MKKHSVAIVGGGISGLSTAFFLSREAFQEQWSLKITVLEASERFGGVIRTASHGDFRMEAGADAFYAGQKDTVELCRELGLQDDVVEAAPCFRRFVSLKNKKFSLLPGIPESLWDAARFLKSSQLSFPAKCRMLCEPFVPRRKEIEDESIADFICRRLGQGFCREAVAPLIQGVYMMNPEGLSVGAMFPKLREGERRYGSLSAALLNQAMRRKEKSSAEFLTLKQGLEGLVQTLVKNLGQCELRRSVPVRECNYREGEGWEILLRNGSVLRADRLGLAMNACESSKLLSRTAPGLSKALSEIRYDSIATLNFTYRSKDVAVRGMAPGFLVPMKGESYPFSSLKCLGKTADGEYLLMRAFVSETMNPGSFRESDETLKQKVLTFLKDFLGIQAEPLWADVERYLHALPQYETGHPERVAKIEKEALQYPGIFFVGNGFRGFGITDCIRQGRLAASSSQYTVAANHS